MCIKSAPYFHQKNVNLALNIMLFDALVLITKFVPNGTIRRCDAGKKNYDAKFAPNIMQTCPK